MNMLKALFSVLVVLAAVVACQPREVANSFLVFLVADGRELTYSLDEPMTVEEFLSRPDVNIRVGDTDRLTPPRFTQLSDGMRITIVRVSETNECETQVLPFSREVIQNEGMQPNEERIIQPGQNGSQQICYRVIIEDGVPRDRIPTGAPTVLRAPVNEILYVGISTNVEPIPIVGTLAYINNNNAWIITGSSTAKRPLTNTGNLDSHVLSLSADGQRLLYTTRSDDPAFVNQLWMTRTDMNAQAMKLVPTNVIYAEWINNRPNTFAYSTSEPQAVVPFWRSLNNLLTMQIDPNTGLALNNALLVPESSGGLSGWWGTVYRWSPDGQRVAYVRADSVGVVGADGSLQPLATYAIFRTTQNWSWRSNVSWSPDAKLLATTVHGPPLGSEPPEASPVFDAVIAEVNGRYSALLHDSAGMWSSPVYSPILGGVNDNAIAYLRARDPYNSVNGEYDLIVADSDGSNARVLFPSASQPGIVSRDFGLTPQTLAWSPDGRQIAVIYQGNLWVVDVVTSAAYQLTFDGQSEHPVWSN